MWKKTADIGPAWALLIVLVLSAVALFDRLSSLSLIPPAIILLGAVSGFGFGGYRGGPSDGTIPSNCKLRADSFPGLKLRECRNGDHYFQERGFLTLIAAIIMLYLFGYFVSVRKMIPVTEGVEPVLRDVPPTLFMIAVVAALTIFGICFSTVKFAFYVRNLTLLEVSVETATDIKNEIAEYRKKRKKVTDAMLDRQRIFINTVEYLRAKISSSDQLYEPAGNLFVTIGITATFLGLSIGLISLDLPGLASLAESAPKVIDDVDKISRDTQQTLQLFVSCMGLSLGASMLGVLIAMAAQWLRGRGPIEGTEKLLGRATALVEAQRWPMLPEHRP